MLIDYTEQLKQHHKALHPLDIACFKELVFLHVEEVNISEVPCENSKWVVSFSFRTIFANQHLVNFFDYHRPNYSEASLSVFVGTHVTKVYLGYKKTNLNWFNPKNWFMPEEEQDLVLEFSNGKYISIPTPPGYIPDESCEAQFALENL